MGLGGTCSLGLKFSTNNNNCITKAQHRGHHQFSLWGNKWDCECSWASSTQGSGSWWGHRGAGQQQQQITMNNTNNNHRNNWNNTVMRLTNTLVITGPTTSGFRTSNGQPGVTASACQHWVTTTTNQKWGQSTTTGTTTPTTNWGQRHHWGCLPNQSPTNGSPQQVNNTLHTGESTPHRKPLSSTIARPVV